MRIKDAIKKLELEQNEFMNEEGGFDEVDDSLTAALKKRAAEMDRGKNGQSGSSSEDPIPKQPPKKKPPSPKPQGGGGSRGASDADIEKLKRMLR